MPGKSLPNLKNNYDSFTRSWELYYSSYVILALTPGSPELNLMLTDDKPGLWEEDLLPSSVVLNNKLSQGHLEVGRIHVIIFLSIFIISRQ